MLWLNYYDVKRSMSNSTVKYMNKLLLLLMSVIISFSVTAQTDSSAAANKAALDSMLNSDEFLKLMDSIDKPISFLNISVGIGNQLFSLNNNALNSQQADVKKLFFTPAISYMHTSGFGLTVTSYVTSDNGSMQIYQTGITPSYDYTGKKITTGMSYTRYISNKSLSIAPSPYQNDAYAYIKTSKGFIRPKFSLGYANGKITEYFDSTFTVNVPLPPHNVHVIDTITTKVQDFSMSLSVEHSFNFENIFSKKDGITITPAFLATANSENLTTTHSSNLNKKRPKIQTLLKSKFGTGSSSAPLELQSIAFSLDASYSIGKFYLQPNFYVDYYLPSTTYNRLTTVFSITAGVTF